MVPIRVELEGFLSYHKRQVLTFEGSPLWMLSGPNGAGKSSVFDAITYSLYGLHRGGLQQHGELINHLSSEMMVQFDFALGDELLRIKRTHSRRNRSSCQAFRLVAGVPVPIAETELREGFKKWIEDTIGLDAEAFTTSVLLQQNKSDALLAADPRTRHSILSQIVDLSAYQELHEAVKLRHGDLSRKSRDLDTQIQGMARIDPNEIERLGDEALQARAASLACVEALQQLAALKVHAGAWQERVVEQRALELELSQVRGLLDRGAQISERHARWSDLKIHLPDLERALALEAEAQSCASKYLEAQHAGASWQLKRQAALELAQAARAQAERLSDELKDWRSRGEGAREALDNLAQPLREVEALEELEAEAAAIGDKLRAFAPGFEDELASARQEHAELAELASALPGLKQFASARRSWNTMKAASDAARQAKIEAESSLAELLQELPLLQQSFDRDDAALEAARADEIRLRALLKSDRERAARLLKSEDIEPDATCDRCGAPLDALHLEEERARRHELIAEMMGELSQAEASVQQARARREASKGEREKSEREIHEAQDQARAAEGEIRNLKGEGLTLCGEVERLLAALPERFRARFAPDVVRASDHFKNEFPASDELRSLDNRATKKPVLERSLQVLEAQERERGGLLARLQPLHERLQPLAARFAPPERTRLLSERDGARGLVAMARARALELEEELSRAQASRDAAGAQAESAARALSQAQGAAERERALEEAKREQRAHLLSRLEGDWKVLAQNARAEDAARLKREQAALREAPEEMAALSSARERLAAQVARAAELAQVLEATPPEQQRAVEEVAAEEARVKAQKERADLTSSECESEKQTMQADARRRQEIVDEQKRVTRDERVHESLSKQLGPNALQRHLLQQAEAVIVENANRLLDTMSGGILQLQLKGSEEAPAPANGKAAAPKALELLAINQATGGRAMPVDFLSGSQKFRVAVALALGIGQFASGGGRGDNRDGHQGSRRIESVIIDEGFGSLDQEGRENIIGELRGLSSILKRVIVVSHQEELARAFPSRYEITLEDGSSTARIIESEG